MYISAIPTQDQCVTLMHHHEMPDHIQRHSFMVAQLAGFLGELLTKNRHGLDLKLIRASALLHDIGKARSLKTGEPHGELGAQMLERWGYLLVAPIVREHATMDLQRAQGPLTESLLVNYADKRVRHDEVVTLSERFHDLAVRYGKTPGGQAAILGKLEIYRKVEAMIFKDLPLLPDSSELMGMGLPPGFFQRHPLIDAGGRDPAASSWT